MNDTKYKCAEVELFTKEQAEKMFSEKTWLEAPLIIHQRFCAELVKVAKENPGTKMCEVPESKNMMAAINVLEKLYPEVKL